MSAGFTWTARRVAQLRELYRAGNSPAAIAALIGAGCEAEHVRTCIRELGGALAGKPAAPGLMTVPRPPIVRRPGLIDLSRAPSAMEQRFTRGRP